MAQTRDRINQNHLRRGVRPILAVFRDARTSRALAAASAGAQRATLTIRKPLRNTNTLNSINYAATSNIGQICRIRRIPNSCRILAASLIAIKRADAD